MGRRKAVGGIAWQWELWLWSGMAGAWWRWGQYLTREVAERAERRLVEKVGLTDYAQLVPAGTDPQTLAPVGRIGYEAYRRRYERDREKRQRYKVEAAAADGREKQAV